jgi:HSP20 family protein
MVWSHSGLVHGWSPWQELQRLQSEMNRIFQDTHQPASGEFPAVDVWIGEHGLRMRAQVPGIDPKDVEVTVVGETLTIKGSREQDELREGETLHRQERGSGKFLRTFELPFPVESDEVRASLRNGVLELELPRAAAQRPRRITIGSQAASGGQLDGDKAPAREEPRTPARSEQQREKVRGGTTK